MELWPDFVGHLFSSAFFREYHGPKHTRVLHQFSRQEKKRSIQKLVWDSAIAIQTPFLTNSISNVEAETALTSIQIIFGHSHMMRVSSFFHIEHIQKYSDVIQAYSDW